MPIGPVCVSKTLTRTNHTFGPLIYDGWNQLSPPSPHDRISHEAMTVSTHRQGIHADDLPAPVFILKALHCRLVTNLAHMLPSVKSCPESAVVSLLAGLEAKGLLSCTQAFRHLQMKVRELLCLLCIRHILMMIRLSHEDM